MTTYLKDPDVTILHGDAIEQLATLPDGSVDCCVTSPPYWGLRDYGTPGQLGLEPTPDEYITGMVAVFREVRRVLKDSGTLWLNIGDSYANTGVGDPTKVGEFTGDRIRRGAKGGMDSRPRSTPAGLKPKDLVGIPWALAFALRADGWYLRSDIIWEKPNPMPESVTDRPTKSHEYVFLLSKSPRYFFDQEAVREPHESTRWGGRYHSQNPDGKYTPDSDVRIAAASKSRADRPDFDHYPHAGRNIRSVWEIATQPYPEAHFATYPEELVRRCILAGTSERGVCPECGKPWEREIEREPAPREVMTNRNAPSDGFVGSGLSRVDGDLLGKGAKLQAWRDEHPPKTIGWRPTCKHLHPELVYLEGAHDPYLRPDEMPPPIPATVLDPFMGSGTTGLVSRKHGRKAIGIELNETYCELASRRLAQQSLLAL